MPSDTIISLSRHTATIAGDVLAMRHRLDQQLTGTPAYARAVTLLGEALECLQLTRRQLEDGLVTAGDLIDGELVGKPSTPRMEL